MRVSTDSTKSKVILLTGAGASMPLGLPDTRSFVSGLLTSTTFKSLEARDSIAADLIGRLRQEVSQDPEMDIEIILTGLDQRRDALNLLLLFDHELIIQTIGIDAELVRHLHRYACVSADVRNAVYDHVVAQYRTVSAERATELYKAALVDFPSRLQDIPE
jgi:hypothetical protein